MYTVERDQAPATIQRLSYEIVVNRRNYETKPNEVEGRREIN